MEVPVKKGECIKFDVEDIKKMLSYAIESTKENAEYAIPICKAGEKLFIYDEGKAIGVEFTVGEPAPCPIGSERVGVYHTHVEEIPPEFSISDIIYAIEKGDKIQCLGSSDSKRAIVKCIEIKDEISKALKEIIKEHYKYSDEVYEKLNKYVAEGKIDYEDAVEIYSKVRDFIIRMEATLLDVLMKKGKIPKGRIDVEEDKVYFFDYCLTAGERLV